MKNSLGDAVDPASFACEEGTVAPVCGQRMCPDTNGTRRCYAAMPPYAAIARPSPLRRIYQRHPRVPSEGPV